MCVSCAAATPVRTSGRRGSRIRVGGRVDRRPDTPVKVAAADKRPHNLSARQRAEMDLTPARRRVRPKLPSANKWPPPGLSPEHASSAGRGTTGRGSELAQTRPAYRTGALASRKQGRLGPVGNCVGDGHGTLHKRFFSCFSAARSGTITDAERVFRPRIGASQVGRLRNAAAAASAGSVSPFRRNRSDRY
ncbi:hypothetical protein HPB47_016096 [Ixodes persulcatus]|uniref:Uncharacterized protein n=1 Tax=Ixodes persulcatus TaxID=34615 RepID=A0AC60QRQ8_IXOPE|nr:hypothetical protein HPB47_016096 [Ixodes persulcatus]